MIALLVIVLAMIVALLVGALVLVFVAYPARGQDVPGVPWLGEAMSRAADAMPTLDLDQDATTEPSRLTADREPDPTEQPTR